MSSSDVLQWGNLAAYGLLGVGAAYLSRREAYRPWALLVLLWAVNNVAFYVEVRFDLLGMGAAGLNFWSSVTKLQGAVMLLVGMAILAYKDRKWKRTDG